MSNARKANAAIPTLASFDLPGKPPTPFRVALDPETVVTFTDPGDLPLSTATALMDAPLDAASTPAEKVRELVREWMAPEDAEALFAADPTVSQVFALLLAAREHYSYFTAASQEAFLGEARA